MFFLTPKFLKHAKLLHKGVSRFIHYKRDVLPQQKLDEITKLRAELVTAMKARDEKRLKALHEEINRACDRALPEGKTGWIDDQVEVVFVSLVIALGIRTYIAQPFQIPTGSMQPTLNGIIAQGTAEDPRPSIAERFGDWFKGRSYVNVVSDRDAMLDPNTPFSERYWNLSLFPPSISVLTPHTIVHLADGGSIVIKGPKDKVINELGLGESLHLRGYRTGAITPDGKPVMQYDADGGGRLKISKGQVLARGIVDWGDHVIVNKFAYHFRAPTRGEVFVFTTKNINSRHMRIPKEQGSQHYIKRLGGVPGDTIDIQPPGLYHNGAPAKEAGFRRVIDNAVDPSIPLKYHGYSGDGDSSVPLPITLKNGARREYFALGDNSYNSSDSRYWGTVPEQNLVGPGWFCYWPLSRHFGTIK